ncbi:MAG: MFS transporter, partial [Mycobacterium leprae]
MSATYQAPKNGFRTFLIVWLTQSISVFGSALTMFAINIWMVTTLYPNPEQKAQLAGALAAVNLAFTIPALSIAMFAGAWADRHDRKMTMFWWDIVSFVLSLVLAILLGTHRLQLWMLLIGAVVNALAATFHGSAFDTAYAMLVPDHQLPRANGMMQTMWALSGVLSPGLAAFLIALPALARQHFAASWFGSLLG